MGDFKQSRTKVPNLTISGDLTVEGDTTTISTTNTVVKDKLIELNNGATSNANDCGIIIERGSTGDNAIFAWDESADGFIVGTTTATGASTDANLTITPTALNTGDITVGSGVAADTKIVFDGNAQDYRIGIDNGDDKLEIGHGQAHGTNTAIAIDSSGQVTKLSLAAAVVAVADDHIVILDGGATGAPKAESIQHLLSAIAGAGISVSGNQLVADGGGTADSVAADNISAGDAAINLVTSDGDVLVEAQAADHKVTIKGDQESGVAIHLDGNAAAASEIQIDAGILDIDVTAGITIDGTTISIDGTDDVNITVTSSGAGEDLTIQQIGANDSSIHVLAAGTGTDAIKIDATAGDMLIAPSLANGKTLKIGPTSATEMVFTPHGTAANEKISLTNTSGTAADAVSIVSTAGGITLTGDTDHGVLVGTVSGGPISIGHTTSETTVNHNLTVTGTATVTSGDVSLGNGQAAVIAVNDTASGTAGKSLTVSAGAAPAASANTNGGDLILSSGAGDGTGTSSMQFKTKVSNTDSVAERMRIHTDGKVGIGVADPDVQLEVFAAATQLKLSYDASNSSAFDVASNGHLTITPSGGKCNIKGDFVVLDANESDKLVQVFDSSDDGVIAGYANNVNTVLIHANGGSHFLGGELGVGVALDDTFAGLFEVQQGADGGKSAVAIINEDIDKIALDINASNTTGNVIDVVANALTTGKAIFIDHNDTATAAVTPVGIHIDFDKSGVTGDGVESTFTGLDIDVNDAATNHSGADVTQTGASIAVASANATGTTLNLGMQISATGADENIQLALMDDASIIAFGADSDTTLTHVHDTGLILNSSRQIQFGDAATHIKQVSDSNLEIEADGSIILDTPVVSFEDDGTILKFGANSEVTLTHVHDTGLLLSDASGVGTTKLMFGDAACFIQQQADGQLGIDADSIINITAPTLDIDASTAVTMTTPSLVIESATGEKPLVVIKNTAGDVDGAILRFVKDKGAAGAANDFNGRIQFFGDDAVQDQVKFSEITSQVKVHTNGQEGGKLSFLVAENDGTATAGLIIEDGDADGELDVTIAAGLASVTAVSGGLQVNGPLIAVMPNVHNFTGNGANATIPVTTASAQIDGNGGVRTGMRFASAGTAGQILVVINTGGENVVFDATEGTALLRGTNPNKDTILPGEAHIFVSDGSLWNHVGGGKTDEGLTIG